MVDYAAQRTSMVDSQVRPSDVTDRRIIRAMQAVPREAYLPPVLRGIAYMDEAIPLSPPAAARTRALLAPRVFARLVQLARIETTDSVLIVAAGTGYSAAVIARLAGEVFALEEDEALAKLAPASDTGSATGHVTRLTGRLIAGSEAQAPFDVIFVEGAVRIIPPALLDQMKDGGRLVGVFMGDGVSRAAIWRRQGATFDRRLEFEAAAGLLPGFEPAPSFVF